MDLFYVNFVQDDHLLAVYHSVLFKIFILFMQKNDFYFHYKNVGRFIILNKFSLYKVNTYNVFNIVKAISYFSVKDLENFDDVCVSNYFFFLYFFFGGQSYFFNYNSVFNLGITYYSFYIQCLFVNRNVFFLLNFVLNEILVGVEKTRFISEKMCFLNFFVKDVSIFIEKRTILGLFNLRHTLNIRFFFLSS